jgi:Zn-dependent M28 family amino/carboxypeptidase
MLQLDMVGAGELPLRVDGGGQLADSLMDIASELGIEARQTEFGRSDHVPFREAGIPGLLLTWRESSDENLPDELADLVLPYRLGVTGRMVALTWMALAG